MGDIKVKTMPIIKKVLY